MPPFNALQSQNGIPRVIKTLPACRTYEGGNDLIFPAGNSIVGVTRDASGVALGGCTVTLYRTTDNGVVISVVSDSNGNFSIVGNLIGQSYYIVAYLDGSPDVKGTTVNTLVAV